MNEALARRLAAMTGLALAAAVALWWLGSTRIALDRGSDAGPPATDALQSLWLARGMALAMLAVRVGALRGWRPGAAAALGLIAPSWPLVVLAWSASTTLFSTVVLGELLLLAAAIALPRLGQGLRRVLRQVEWADLVATGVGVALAAALWFTRGLWLLLPS
ncbi:MAG: hypothetical protein Q8K96_18945 [Rubrivivax sp.]|nr:hypothetical protein [Rubrivivax sp.]